MRTLVVALCLAAPALGQTYSLLLRASPEEGKSALVRQESKQVVDSTVKDADGKELKRDQRKVSEVSEYTLAVQEVKDNLPTRFSHAYSKAEATGKEKKQMAWAGRKVLFEVAKGKVTAKVAEGKALPKEAVEALEGIVASRFLDSVAPLLPPKDVKAGEEWTVDPKQAASGLKVPFDPKGSKASGKLVKVYEKGGHRFGVMELKADLVLKLPDGGKGKLEYEVKIDAAIDGKSTLGTYRADVTITGSQTVEEKTKEGKSVKRVLGGTTRGTVTMEIGEQK